MALLQSSEIPDSQTFEAEIPQVIYGELWQLHKSYMLTISACFHSRLCDKLDHMCLDILYMWVTVTLLC
jgi:hypothetical protein